MAWDDPLSAPAELIAACADQGLGAATGLRVHRVVVDLPLELQTATGADGAVTLGAAPPRQAGATSVMPVLHRMRLVVEATG